MYFMESGSLAVYAPDAIVIDISEFLVTVVYRPHGRQVLRFHHVQEMLAPSALKLHQTPVLYHVFYHLLTVRHELWVG